MVIHVLLGRFVVATNDRIARAFGSDVAAVGVVERDALSAQRDPRGRCLGRNATLVTHGSMYAPEDLRDLCAERLGADALPGPGQCRYAMAHRTAPRVRVEDSPSPVYGAALLMRLGASTPSRVQIPPPPLSFTASGGRGYTGRPAVRGPAPVADRKSVV